MCEGLVRLGGGCWGEEPREGEGEGGAGDEDTGFSDEDDYF